MNETGFRIFSEAFSVGANFLYAICLTLFLRPFMMEQKYRQRKLALIFLTYMAVCLLCGTIAAPKGTFSLLMTVLLVAESRVLGLGKAMAFLLALLYWNARVSSGLIAESLYFIVEQLVFSHVEPIETLYLRTAVLVTLFLLSHAALLSVMLYIFQRQLRKQRMPLHLRELYYVSLVPAEAVLFGQIFSRLLFEFQDGILIELYEKHPVFLLIMPLLALLFYVGTFLTIRFQQEMTALQEERATYFVERQQTQAIQARIHEAEQFYTHIRRLKHEMRGHLTNIKGLAQNEEYASLKEYISQIDESISDFNLTLQTGNPVTDVIVNDKQQQCLDLNIRFQTEFHYPEGGAYNAFDMGIILHNLLQNALEACEKVMEEERFITLTGKRRGHFFLIEVKNSFAGVLVFGQDGIPLTTKKENAPMHGIGLCNVRREAEKYMGELELKVKQQEFCATVLLQERSNNE